MVKNLLSKDKVVSWFIKNVVKPRREVLDNPGFIAMEPDKSAGNRKRQILMSESIIEDIEDTAVEEGKEDLLYSIGKKFGKRFSSLYNTPQKSDLSNEKLEKQIYYLVRFISATYASEASSNVDIEEKKYELETKDFVVCRNNGKGIILEEGGSAGIWAHIMEDEDIEAVKTSCEGRGDPLCRVIAGTPSLLTNEDLDYSVEKDISELDMARDYPVFNEIRGLRYAENSFKSFIDNGFFEYSGGIVRHEEERYFLSEVSLPYLIEKELEPEDSSIVFDAAFEHGKKLGRMEQDRKPVKFLREFLAASGWGDTRVKEKDDQIQIQAYNFPWTRFYEETSFSLYRGLVSGILTGIKDEEIILDTVEKDSRGEEFDLTISN